MWLSYKRWFRSVFFSHLEMLRKSLTVEGMTGIIIRRICTVWKTDDLKGELIFFRPGILHLNGPLRKLSSTCFVSRLAVSLTFSRFNSRPSSVLHWRRSIQLKDKDQDFHIKHPSSFFYLRLCVSFTAWRIDFFFFYIHHSCCGPSTAPY